jgi:hypothetical protein
MTDDELDAWMSRAHADMLEKLSEVIDTEAALRRLLQEQARLGGGLEDRSHHQDPRRDPGE